MSFGFRNIGHFFATVAGDIVKGARVVSSVMLKAQKAEPKIEALSALIFPQAARRVRAVLGMAAHAVAETGDADAANGINITLDQQLIADIKELIVAIEAYAKSAGMAKPAAAAK